MGSFTAVFAMIYLAAIVGVGVFILILLTRFVKAHQRSADALEAIARNLFNGGTR